MIILTNKGEKILVDKKDYILLPKQKWGIDSVGYPRIQYDRKGTKRLHTFILDIPKGKMCDHINGNKLDNRRKNLRVCSHAENQRNKGLTKLNTWGYKGIDFRKGRSKPFSASICLNQKKIHLGSFKTLEEAAEKYNEGAIKYHGEFAKLNGVDFQEKLTLNI